MDAMEFLRNDPVFNRTMQQYADMQKTSAQPAVKPITTTATNAAPVNTAPITQGVATVQQAATAGATTRPATASPAGGSTTGPGGAGTSSNSGASMTGVSASTTNGDHTADPGGFSSKGIAEGFASFAPNVGAVITGPLAAAAYAMNAAMNPNQSKTPSVMTTLSKAIGLVDKDPTDFGFMPALDMDPAFAQANLPDMDTSSFGDPNGTPSTPSFGADFGTQTEGMFDGSAASFGGITGAPNAPEGTVNGMSVGGLGVFGAVDASLGTLSSSFGNVSSDDSDSSDDGSNDSDGHGGEPDGAEGGGSGDPE